MLRGLSLTLESGEAVTIQGPNGSGKSTLLKIIAGLLRPTQGTITITTGNEAWKESLERRRLIGYASPDLAFYPELTGHENLRFFQSVRGQEGKAVDAACTEALKRVGLGTRGDDPVAAYSSGMRQRLRLAFAMLADAPVLLLDEPSLALDTQGVQLIGEMIATQRTHGGITLLATNDPEEAKLGDRAVVLG